MAISDPKPDGRGGAAETPAQIPFHGWRDIAIRLKNQIAEDNIGIISAGVAFYALLAVFPALSAIVATYGLAFDPSDVQQHMEMMVGLLPEDARALLLGQLASLTSGSSAKLGIGVIVGLGIAFWSSTKGAKAVIKALNIVYGERESRGFIKLNLVALTFTFSAIMIVVLAMVSVVVVPTILSIWDGFDFTVRFLAWLRWPLVAMVIMFALSAVYRFGPSRRKARWRWVSPGGMIATLLWLAGSWLFSQYVSHFGNYNETYGSIGAVVILLMWFFVSTWIVLLGAEINAEIEHQTTVDTTIGRPKPLGQRGAKMADTIGERYFQEDK